MKKIFSLFILCLTMASSSFGQLGHNNMYLIKNLNQHPVNLNFPQRLYSAVWGYVAPNGREYAILGCSDGTAFIDVTDSASISEVGFVPSTNPSSSSNNWREMKTYSHYAYIVSEVNNSGIQIVDLQYLPDSIRYLGKFTIPGHTSSHTISQSGPYLYINGGNATFGDGTVIVDITNPTNPVKRGGYNNDYVHDSRILNDTIWAANIYDEKLTVISATNKDNPTFVKSWSNLPGSGPHNCAITPDRKHILVTDEIGTAPFRLKIWNIQDLNNITYVTAWQPTGITQSVVHNVEIYGNYAIVAHYSAGIRVVDISNPANPIEVAWYDTYPSNNSENYNGCWGVYLLPSGKIIASDRQTGLYVVKTNFTITGVQGVNNQVPDGFALNQNYPNPFNPSTKISFSLPKNTFVSLKLYDISGKELTTLVNDRRDAGNYEVTFDAAKLGLASGVYFYSLTSDDFKETKKMILAK